MAVDPDEPSSAPDPDDGRPPPTENGEAVLYDEHWCWVAMVHGKPVRGMLRSSTEAAIVAAVVGRFNLDHLMCVQIRTLNMAPEYTLWYVGSPLDEQFGVWFEGAGFVVMDRDGHLLQEWYAANDEAEEAAWKNFWPRPD